MKTFFLLLPLIATPGWAAWSWQTVTTAGSAWYPTIATRTVTPNSVTYVAFATAPASVTVAYPSSGAWALETVESGVDVLTTALAIDSAGTPHVAYFDRILERYRYAKRVLAGTGNCGTALRWQCLSIPLPPGSPVGYAYHIRLTASGGTVHFAFEWANSPGAPRMIYYSQLTSDDLWTLPVALPSGKVPGGLLVNASNVPYVPFTGRSGDAGLGGMNYQPAGWTSESWSGGNAYYDVELRFWRTGMYGCYARQMNSPDYPANAVAIGYALRNSAGSWSLQAVGQGYRGALERYCSFANYADGDPAIAFLDGAPGSNPAVKLATLNAGIWSTVVLDNSGSLFGSPILARGSNGKLTLVMKKAGGIVVGTEN